MIDIFDDKVDLKKITCHSGGAIGSDTVWEQEGSLFGVDTKAYSYKTKKHKSPNKVEISDADYNEGVLEINKANKILSRFGINRFMNLLARNWAQVKYSDEVFAIGYIIEPGKKGQKGYYNKSKQQTVDGGTGYAVQMAINNNKTVFVFDQSKDSWFRWSYTTESFIIYEKKLRISKNNFAGIGTRDIKDNGIEAIRNIYIKTFENENIF